MHFGVCGGCQYQHADETTQVGWKVDILGGLLADAGLEAMPPIESVSGAPWGYRNRIRLRLQGLDGVLRVGYSRRGTNDFLPIVMCPIAAPALWRAAEALLWMAAEQPRWGQWLRVISEVEFFCSGDEERMQMQVFVADTRRAEGVSAKGLAEFCEALRELLPELAGAGAVAAPELNRQARRGWTGNSWGAAGLTYGVAGRSYWVSRGAFFQVNRFLVERLVDLACEGAEGALAWDLYAGVGLFSRVLAERSGRVVAVEGGEAAAADLAVAGRKYGFEARRQTALDFLRGQEHQRDRPDLVVLDPPRAGLGAEGATVLARSGAARVVYVSCDPVTLARDLAVLVAGGYRVEKVTLVDLFPQTYHLETVVRLARLRRD